MTPLRVLRVYHSGRDRQHRARDRALVDAGVPLTLVVPAAWPDSGSEESLSTEAFPVVELEVRRPGDVNRHTYVDEAALRRAIVEARPDVLDIHEEPFSLAARQWLRAAGPTLPVVMYTAQNVDKRFPPPFCWYESNAYRRVSAFYPCSRQAASVIRGKGFGGPIEVMDLGYDDTVFTVGNQAAVRDGEIAMALIGRMVPEKGVVDAVRVLARVNAHTPARLVLRGAGPELSIAREVAESLGVVDRLDVGGWLPGPDLARIYRNAHVVLVPSYPTDTWVEQYGRVIVEAQACGALIAGYASGAIPDVGGAAALISPVGDVDQLGAATTRVLADPVEYARRRDHGIRQAASRTWRAIASRQIALYAAARASPQVRPKPVASPQRRRDAARAEFGTTASTPSGRRPFALPLLRRSSPFSRSVAATLDRAAELRSKLPPRS